MAIRTCPSCGGKRLRRQTVALTATVGNRKATVPDLEIEICPDCGERLFDLEASRRMEERFVPKRCKRAVVAA